MPLRLSISLGRKVGEANYGSRGATVGLELEAEATLVQQPAGFQKQVANLFRLARESVDRELARARAQSTNGSAANGVAGHRTASQPPRVLRTATRNQIRALRAIAGQYHLELQDELMERYGVAQVTELSLGQASALIDALKAKVCDPEQDALVAAEPQKDTC